MLGHRRRYRLHSHPNSCSNWEAPTGANAPKAPQHLYNTSIDCVNQFTARRNSASVCRDLLPQSGTLGGPALELVEELVLLFLAQWRTTTCLLALLDETCEVRFQPRYIRRCVEASVALGPLRC